MIKKVAIVGYCNETRDLAPYDDYSWEIWSVATAYGGDFLKRVSSLFEIHPRNKLAESHIAKIKTIVGIPIYMQRTWDDIPDSIEFPIKTFIKPDDWFVNSFSMMIPFAVHLNFKEIELYGVDAEYDWGYQWDCLSYQARKAREKGVSVKFVGAKRCEVPRVYGYEYMRQGLDVFPHSEKEADAQWQ